MCIRDRDGEDRYDSSAVHIMNLETGESAQIKAPEGSSIRLLGFVGSDLVYGLAEENSSVKVNGRTVQAPMYLSLIHIYQRCKNGNSAEEQAGN